MFIRGGLIYMIITMNVNGFCGLCNNCKPNCKNNQCFQARTNNMNRIKDLLNIQLAEDVAILQEVPYASNENIMYKEFEKIFSEYTIVQPLHLQRYAKQCTIAIFTKNSNWKSSNVSKLCYNLEANGSHRFGNKFIELQHNNLELLGVHMPYDQKAWKNLISSSNRFSIIVGDFNAHENEHRHEKKSSNLPFLREHNFIDAVPSNAVTYYPTETTLDHFFFQKNKISESNITISIFPSGLSDHATILVELRQ